MKNHQKLKKFTAVGLASLLSISGSASFVGAAKVKADTLNRDTLVAPDRTEQKRIAPTPEPKDHEKVRVIVELEGAPAISYSIKKGIRYKDLPETKKVELQSEVKDEQKDFLTDVKEDNVDFKVDNTFTTVVNGVSGEIEYGQIDELESLPNVESVNLVNEYERPKEEPNMLSSKKMVQAIQTWHDSYTGRGMVVGIIDTGIDSSHPDMTLNEDPKNKLTKTKTDELISANNLQGKYFTTKVPYGYNYADKNQEILDLGPNATMHGMHVAGIVGANGDESGNGIKGVAPEAQLLALKVFSNDPANPSTYGDIYVKAIDDGIKLGADVLNMSLGSPAGFVNSDSIEQKAVERAVNSGVLMSIAAGNSDQIGSGGPNPFASNPDIGLVGDPSVATNSISVANIENDYIQLDEMKVTVGNETLSMAFQRQSAPNPVEVFGTNKDLDVVYVGNGYSSQYDGKDVKGKIVYAIRKSTTSGPNYAAIQATAQAAGAAGVIIRGHETHGDYVHMALSNPTIPVVSIGISDGNDLESKLIAAGGTGKVTFTGKMKTVVNSAAGRMNSSTSWGVTPSLELKPEITAPGGQIYSTLNDGKYGTMSGTSMSAPHVSGGAALVLQKVQQLFPNLQGADKVKRVKTLLMNTAKPVQDPDDNNIYYSPRRQGAGLMQLYSAINTPVYVVRKGTNDAKVELKEIKTDKFEMTLTATNFSDKDVTYNVDTSVLTDAISNGRNALKSQVISKAIVTTDSPTLSLVPGQSKDFTISIDLTNAKAELEAAMKNGYFVEGFITLKNDSQDAGLPDISVPYVGFKGDWNAAPILDDTMADPSTSYFSGLTYGSGFVDQDGNAIGNNYGFLGTFNKAKLAISPNGDKHNDALSPVLQFLRNSKTVEYSITDRSGNTLRKLYTNKYGERKDYYTSGKAQAGYSYKPEYTQWDGKVNNKLVPEGLYYYTIKTQVDYPGKPQQVVNFPVVVDNTAPVISNATYSKNKLYFKVQDNGSGISDVDIYTDNKKVWVDNIKEVNPTTKEYVVDLKELKDKYNVDIKNNIDIVVWDNASNGSIVTLSSPDNTIPYIVSNSPSPTGAYNTRDISVTGYVTDSSLVKYLHVRSDKLVGDTEKNIDLTYNPTLKRYDFKSQIKFSEDGVHDVFFVGEDVVGNKIEFRRQIFIDTQSAKLDIKGLPANNYVAKNAADPEITALISDNFDAFRLTVNGNEEDNKEFEKPFEQRPLNYEHKMTLKLSEGRNDFQFYVTDLTGHITFKTISIYKGDTPPTPFITSLTGTQDKDVSVNNPFTFKAGASKPIVWDFKVIDPNGNEIKIDSTKNPSSTYNGSFTPNGSAASGVYKAILSPVGGSKADRQIVKFNVTNNEKPGSGSTNPSNFVKVNEVSDKDKLVTGEAEANSKVTIKVGKVILASGTVNTSETFSLPIRVQKAGTILEVTVTDQAGKEIKTNITVKDKTAPTIPSVKNVTYTKISGTAEKGSKVYAKSGKEIIGSSVVNSTGKFSISFKKQKVGTILYVYALDKSGNVGANKQVKIKDITPPAIPSVSSISKTKMSGKAEPGAKVYVKSGKVIIGSTTANSKGIYTVNYKKQKVGATLYVYAKDKAGNIGQLKKVVVKK
ncbi:S8 family serine peptidase [Bacillus sp. AFS017336]|uniref:S8 family serine peptidase n=1 Tax=Bacillus sp. AFS017336 TaxID=2033489 RepID=UPI000BEFDB48|nr:S8 family serine peptidase [Bacillus sp. AFS017336]PEK98849.1 peptidase S8 and S53 subtilisin kexin sedolisin [Bacillus sp. AFS017336]